MKKKVLVTSSLGEIRTKKFDTLDTSDNNKNEQGPQTHKLLTSNSPNQNLIKLTKTMSRPPGNSFIGSKPSSTKVNMNNLQGPKTDIIIDSGSDITLISSKTLL